MQGSRSADRRRRASLTLAFRSGIETGWGLSPHDRLRQVRDPDSGSPWVVNCHLEDGRSAAARPHLRHMKHRIAGVPQLDNPLADIACNHLAEGGVCLKCCKRTVPCLQAGLCYTLGCQRTVAGPVACATLRKPVPIISTGKRELSLVCVCLWFILYWSQIAVRIPCPIPAAA